MKKVLFAILFAYTGSLFSQETTVKKDSLTFIFMGDVMGHDPQIASAYDSLTRTYNYNSVFAKVKPIIEKYDYAIANLEVTLAGAPYKGYPQFSSPDALPLACKNSGIDVMVTSNNHSCDRGKKGLLRTIGTLDALQLKHTGTFKNLKDRNKNNLLVLDKNNIKVGLLNYTYGTNGLPTPKPTQVNRIDTLAMKNDILESKKANLDKLIVMIHWGPEYKSHPSKKQISTANFLFKQGVDIIIGAHPHVLQKMEYFPKDSIHKERLIAYSLGNFVSNQRARRKDGGGMISFTLTKSDDEVKINNPKYHLTWVHKPIIDKKTKFEILPCKTVEKNGFKEMDSIAVKQMKLFIKDSRTLYKKENKLVTEINY